MLDFDKMREEQLKRVNSFEEACKIYAEDCPVIIELLESHPMTLYRLFEVDKNSFEAMEGIAHSLHHAFVDDGAYHVAREVCHIRTDMKKRLNKVFEEKGMLDKIQEVPVYTYCLKGGDSDSNSNIGERHLSEMIEVDSLHYAYYETHKKAIEAVGDFDERLGVRRPCEERQKYHELSNLLEKYLEQLYFETLWEETEL